MNLSSLSALAVGIGLAFGQCSAASILTIDYGSTAIGTLVSSVDPFGDESATFTLYNSYRSLLSDTLGTQFRFFQVIYYDDEPATYQGALITPPSAPAHSGTLVDTPAGGWDYELPGGDDNSPFYESDTENNPATNEPYAFPTLSYPDLHSPDGVNPGTVSTLDSPGLANPNDSTLFETFLVYSDPSLAAQHTFDLLGGYAWGIQTDSSGNEFGIDTTNLTNAAYSPSGTA